MFKTRAIKKVIIENTWAVERRDMVSWKRMNSIKNLAREYSIAMIMISSPSYCFDLRLNIRIIKIASQARASKNCTG